MADKPNLMRGRESWIFLELCLYLLAHFRGGGCKSVPSWCHRASMNGHMQSGQRNDHRVCCTIFWARGNVAEGAEWKRRTSVWWTPLGPLRLMGLSLPSSLKLGFHPAHFVCFGNEDFKGNFWGQVSSAMWKNALWSLDSCCLLLFWPLFKKALNTYINTVLKVFEQIPTLRICLSLIHWLRSKIFLNRSKSGVI